MFNITGKYADVKLNDDGTETVKSTRVMIERPEPYTVLSAVLKGDCRGMDEDELITSVMNEVYKRDFAAKYQNEAIEKTVAELEALKENELKAAQLSASKAQMLAESASVALAALFIKQQEEVAEDGE